MKSKVDVPRWERRLVGATVRGLFGYRNRRGRRWAVPDWLPHERFVFEGNTGAQVSARWFPAADAGSVVVLAHPDRRYGQHWFVTAGWIDWLKERGFHALTFDFPGYGDSRGGSTYFFEDVLAAVAEARKRAPGLPLHVVGLSIGAFAAANASPYLDDVASLVLESPYPSFNAWYGRGPGRWGMAFFDRVFPRTSRLIQADENLSRSRAARILVVAAKHDTATPVGVSRRVAEAGPPGRTRYLELDDVDHLEAFHASEEYRTALLETLGGPGEVYARPRSATRLAIWPATAPATKPASMFTTTSGAHD